MINYEILVKNIPIKIYFIFMLMTLSFITNNFHMVVLGAVYKYQQNHSIILLLANLGFGLMLPALVLFFLVKIYKATKKNEVIE